MTKEQFIEIFSDRFDCYAFKEQAGALNDVPAMTVDAAIEFLFPLCAPTSHSDAVGCNAVLEWKKGAPTKPGKWLLAIPGSEDAIPAVLSIGGRLYSQVTTAAAYDPDAIAYHAAWPIFPRERDERWIECDRRTCEDWNKGFSGMTQVFSDGDSVVYEKRRDGSPVARMEVNMYGHYGVRYFRWPTIREYFDPQQENQKP